MAAISIPRPGQAFAGNDPDSVKTLRLTVGFAATNDVVTVAQATYALFNVVKGVVVHEIGTIVNTAFTTSVTMTIGDGADADGFMASAQIAPTSAVTSGIISSGKATEAAAGAAYVVGDGKVYGADDTIDVVVAGATPTAGQLDLYIRYSEVGAA